jgi:hypothetical protein
MNIWALDSALGKIKKIEYINLSWTEKYYEPGQFEMLLTNDEWNDIYLQGLATETGSDTIFLYNVDRPEHIGVVQKTAYTEKYGAKIILASGYFFEKLLDSAIISNYPTAPYPFIGNATPEQIAWTMASYYQNYAFQTVSVGAERVYLNENFFITMNEPPSFSTPTINYQQDGGELGKKCYELLATQNLSLKISLDLASPYANVNFDIWKGEDRRTGANQLSFSSQRNNIFNIEHTIDNSNQKFVALVEGTNSDGALYIEKVGDTGDQIFVEAHSIKYDPENMTFADFQAQLQQKGLEELQKYKLIENISFEVENDVEFKLGDVANIHIPERNVDKVSRIIEINEVQKGNNLIRSVVFGDKIPSILDKSNYGGKR